LCCVDHILKSFFNVSSIRSQFVYPHVVLNNHAWMINPNYIFIIIFFRNLKLDYDNWARMGLTQHNLVIGSAQWLSCAYKWQNMNYNSRSAHLHVEKKEEEKQKREEKRRRLHDMEEVLLPLLGGLYGGVAAGKDEVEKLTLLRCRKTRRLHDMEEMLLPLLGGLYGGVAAGKDEVEKLTLLRCMKITMKRKKMKKLAAAVVVVVVTVTSEQMGWWRRLGHSWSRCYWGSGGWKNSGEGGGRGWRRKKLIFLPTLASNFLISIHGILPYLLGVEKGHFVFTNVKSWPLIRPRRIITIDSKWSSWTVNIVAKSLLGLAILRRRRNCYGVN